LNVFKKLRKIKLIWRARKT